MITKIKLFILIDFKTVINSIIHINLKIFNMRLQVKLLVKNFDWFKFSINQREKKTERFRIINKQLMWLEIFKYSIRYFQNAWEYLKKDLLKLKNKNKLQIMKKIIPQFYCKIWKKYIIENIYSSLILNLF